MMRIVGIMALLVAVLTASAIGQSTQCTSRDFVVRYSSYINADHVDGPTACQYVVGAIPLIYEGGMARPTFRTMESIQLTPALRLATSFEADTGVTRNYDGINSPVNGTTLSSADLDGTEKDCFKFNEEAKADPSGFRYETSFPFTNQGQVRFWGTSANPLETQIGGIRWDIRVVVNTQTTGSATAYVNYNHSCFPAHRVVVNDAQVYSYIPPRQDIVYVANCLLLLRDPVVGQTPASSVPTY